MKLILLTTRALAFGAALWMGTVNATEPVRGESLIWGPPALCRLLEEGLQQNKEILSLKAKLESLKEQVPFAGSLDDPRVGVGALNLPTDTFSFRQEPMTQKQLFIAQKIPWFGKLSLREQRQTLAVERQEALLMAKRFELARKIATAYYDLGFVRTSLKINERLTDMVGQVLRVVETKYATGKGLQQDVLQAQVELTKLLDETIVLKNKYHLLEDKLHELLNRVSFDPVDLADEPIYPELKIDGETLKAMSLKQNPWLAVRRAEVDQAAVTVELARKDYWPDLDFKVAYGQREEDAMGRELANFFSASVTMNVPLWQRNRQDKNLAAQLKNLEAATRVYERLKNVLPYRVDSLVTDIQNTQENFRLFSDALLVQAEQWARSSLTAYVVGKVEFNTTINAQIRLLKFELQSKRYLYDIYKKRAELEEVVGGPLCFEGANKTDRTEFRVGKRLGQVRSLKALPASTLLGRR